MKAMHNSSTAQDIYVITPSAATLVFRVSCSDTRCIVISSFPYSVGPLLQSMSPLPKGTQTHRGRSLPPFKLIRIRPPQNQKAR